MFEQPILIRKSGLSHAVFQGLSNGVWLGPVLPKLSEASTRQPKHTPILQIVIRYIETHSGCRSARSSSIENHLFVLKQSLREAENCFWQASQSPHSTNPTFWPWSSTRLGVSAKFQYYKLLKAVSDVSRCALSNETTPEIISRADPTLSPDRGRRAFWG